MDEQIINRINRQLNLFAAVELICCLSIAALGEFGILPVGIVPEESIYLFQIIACLLTVICVPVALKLFSWSQIRCRIASNPQEYQNWGTIRLQLLFFPMFIDIFFHYLLMDMSLFYLALICAVAALYVWPSKARMMQETQEY